MRVIPMACLSRVLFPDGLRRKFRPNTEGVTVWRVSQGVGSSVFGADGVARPTATTGVP
jgi:hypothetical protein